MRLIDADSLGNEFDEQMYYLQWEVDSVANPHRFQRAEGINWCRNTLNNAPTVDSVPVVHARWIHTGVTNIYGGHQHKCSSCGHSLMVSPACDSENYCCNCGARMDGAE